MNIRSAEVALDSDKRTQIIECAIVQFVTKGFQQTSMAQLSQESGVAIGTIYHYFKSKDELIEEIYLYMGKKWGEAVAIEDGPEVDYKAKHKNSWIKGYFFSLKTPTIST